MKKSTVANVLRAAKPFLFTDIGLYGRTEYICHAVGNTKYSETTKLGVMNIIVGRLGKTKAGVFNHDVESWLRQVLKVPNRDMTFENVQNFRHRWLDSLVEEFS